MVCCLLLFVVLELRLLVLGWGLPLVAGFCWLVLFCICIVWVLDVLLRGCLWSALVWVGAGSLGIGAGSLGVVGVGWWFGFCFDGWAGCLMAIS